MWISSLFDSHITFGKKEYEKRLAQSSAGDFSKVNMSKYCLKIGVYQSRDMKAGNFTSTFLQPANCSKKYKTQSHKNPRKITAIAEMFEINFPAI